jgi:RNA-directed DNA polymerase
MHELKTVDFCEPENHKALALFIGIEESVFKKLLTSGKVNGFFVERHIRKWSKHRIGEYRTVWEVAYSSLNDTYKSFARRFDLFARKTEKRFPHPAAYGYVRGRNIVDNATRHSGAPLILHADITNFFPSISIQRIEKMFKSLQLNDVVAEALSQFVTINGALPLGLPPSPLLANIVCLDLDEKLNKLANDYDCIYTRYADDITISGEINVPSKNEIKEILESEGFSLSERKFRLTKRGQAHYVTGLSVTDANLPRAPRSMKKRLRQELFYCQKYGINNHLRKIGCPSSLFQNEINRIDGTVRYIAHIEKDTWPTLHEEWREIQRSNKAWSSYASLEDRPIRHISCFVDETEISFNQKNILAMSLALTDETDKITASTLGTLQDYLDKPLVGGNKKRLKEEGLHYNAADEDLRTAYIERLSTLPFRAFIAYDELASYDKYEELYISLIKKLLPYRLKWCDGAILTIVFEENKSKVSEEKIKQAVKDVYNMLVQTNDRRPIKEPVVIIGKKLNYPCFSVPDFILAVFSKYARHHIRKEDSQYKSFAAREERQFELLRDKIRAILGVKNEGVYTNMRPFTPWPNKVELLESDD